MLKFLIFDFRFSISKIANIMCFLLCFVFLSLNYSLIASAQEPDVHVEVSVESATDKNDGAEAAKTGDSAGVEQNKQDRGKDKVKQDKVKQDKVKRTPMEQARQSQQDEASRPERQNRQFGQRMGETLPPEVRKIMQEENISTQDLQDPEIREKLREKVELMRLNSPSPPDARARGGAPGRGMDEGLKRYMTAIVERNLFLPLGSGPQEEKSSFALTAVLGGSDSKAIIEELGSGKSYYVSEGDVFANDVKVVDIEEQVVKLERSGRPEELRLGVGTTSSVQRGRRVEKGPGGGEVLTEGGGKTGEGVRKEGSGGFDPGQLPPFALEILKARGISLDELQRNPELREKLRREFEDRFRGGGEGRPGAQQPFRQEFRQENRDRRPPR